MKHRTVGPFSVSALGLGCMTLSHAYGNPPDPATAANVLRRALDLGYNFFDTAAQYGFGANETLLGNVLKDRRRDIVLASKAGMFRNAQGVREVDARPEVLKKTCDDALIRLQTDVIDLYYLHRWDKRVPVEDSIGALSDLVKQGKVRTLGISEVSAPTLRKAHAVHPITALQTEYSLWTRDAEVAVLDACEELGIAFVANDENSGFSRTVNVGLELAHAMEHDAVLVNADIEFPQPGWLENMRDRTDTEGRPAAVVGARLLYPNGLIQHAGVVFSLLNRDWLHRYRFGPANLPEALSTTRCIVTAALQFIRWETLDQIGLYDEGYRLCYEDVDYCLRVFKAGLECIYEPSVVATHHESYFRKKSSPEIKRWTLDSIARMRALWGAEDLSRWVPETL
jgi:diketogulonate reductase-like aldo/keto reductase